MNFQSKIWKNAHPRVGKIDDLIQFTVWKSNTYWNGICTPDLWPFMPITRWVPRRSPVTDSLKYETNVYSYIKDY